MKPNELRIKMVRTRRWFKLRSHEQALFHELIFIAYLEKKIDSFTCYNSTLCTNLHMDERTLVRARNKLIEAGLIRYVSKKKDKMAGVYSFPVHSESPAKMEVELPPKMQDGEPPNLPANLPDNYSSSSFNIKINKKEFEEFHRSYPGAKRSPDTEYEAFIKTFPDDYESILPHLLPAVEKLKRWRRRQINLGRMVPEYKTIRSWLGQREWEYEHPNTYHYDD